jgi:radical SAM PhpK family P-methyltransferase
MKHRQNSQSQTDCLIIGFNEMNFEEYEQSLRRMGTHDGAYRDLYLDFIYHKGRALPVGEVFNLFRHPSVQPIRLEEDFSATISYLGSYLHRRGFSFDYINSFQDEKDLLAEKLKEGGILTVAITTTLYVSVMPILEIMEFIRQYNSAARIIVGGPFVYTQVESLDGDALSALFNLIDADYYVYSSQGEAALVDLLTCLKQGRTVEGVNNLYYRDGGDYTATTVSRENNPLAANIVDWSLFQDRLTEHVTMRTSISCPFKCGFCGFPTIAGPYETINARLIQRELDQLADSGAVKYLHFIDDTFNVPVERFKDILRMMIKRKYPFKWHSYFRCQFADEETVELMKSSGCEGVFLGVESGSDRILKNMNKAATVEQYLHGIKLLKQYGIVTQASFIMGFPGETAETARETDAFIKESGLDFYRIVLWYCLHHTPIWQKRDQFQIEGRSFNWRHATLDSRTACDYIDEIYFSEKSSIWMPHYNFDEVNFWHLMHRGFTIDQAKRFLTAFNDAVKEKIESPPFAEPEPSTLRALKEACDIQTNY